MKQNKIIIKTRSKTYPIYFGDNILNLTGKLIKKNLPSVKKICIISDKNLPSNKLKIITKSLNKYKIKIYKFSVNENLKNFKTSCEISENLLKDGYNRSDLIIAFGGGILGDLSAFISSITKRGLFFINIPTTLLAQSDSAIGGKTGVNSKFGKNLIGTFYQPDFVITDLSLLDSLPKREMICGYGEILKHSLILNKKFFFWLCKNAKKIINYKDKKLLKEAVIKSCKIKSEIVNKDEKERNLRMILNFGHTFAHGFEGATNFSKKINHGEAVLLGMLAASKFSNKINILSKNNLNIIKNHYINLKLPMNLKNKIKRRDVNKILLFMSRDKKNISKKINLILLKNIGKTTKPNEYSFQPKIIKEFLINHCF